MSLEQLKALFGKAQADIALRQKLQNAGNQEAVLAIARSAGFNISSADFDAAQNELDALSGQVKTIAGSSSPLTVSANSTYSNHQTIQVGDFWSPGVINNHGTFENYYTINLGPWGSWPWLNSHFNNYGSFDNINGGLTINSFGSFVQRGEGTVSYGRSDVTTEHRSENLENHGIMDLMGKSFNVLGGFIAFNFNKIINGTLFTVSQNSQIDNTSGGVIENYSDIIFKDITVFYNDAGGLVKNSGDIIFEYTDYSAGNLLRNDGVIDSRDGVLKFSSNTGVTGSGKIITNNGGLDHPGIMSPGNSAGGMLIDGDLRLGNTSQKRIELGGEQDFNRDQFNTEYDFLDVTGDLIINGGKLQVSLINDFKLQRDQEFIISRVEGELIGHYDGLAEGSVVSQFESIYGKTIDLHISYVAGDGNDIGLYTKPHTNPEMIFEYS